MRLADQHSHSFPCSFDAADTLHTMAAAAKDRGLSGITFTDHLDMSDPKTGRLVINETQLLQQLDSFAARRAEYEAQPIAGLEVSFGMELGAAVQEPALAARAAGLPGLDLVIGSLHNLPDVTDFYFYEYQSEADCEALNRRYLAELLRLAELDCFDVMGHIGYTARYMHRHGFREQLTVEKYGDELSCLLRRLIKKGRGIECNTSGFGDVGAPFPGRDILCLYRQLGGEIITVGSDAHHARRAGENLREACELLKDCGFRYICAFRERKGSFIPLE